MFDKAKIINYFYRWVRLKQNGITLGKYLEDRKISKVAVYGYSLLTECLIYELDKSNVKLEFLIDRNAGNLVISFPKYKLEQAPLKEVSHILIMPVDDYETIKNDIIDQMHKLEISNIGLLTFEELIYEL